MNIWYTPLRYDFVYKAQGGHSNTNIVHMRDQMFLKDTLIAIFPLQEKQPLNKNFVQFCPQIYPWTSFVEDIFGGVWKMTPKRPLIESKTTLFPKKRHILTPHRSSRE